MSSPTDGALVAPPLVVVVAYRSDELLRTCLESLTGALEVLVVDNDAAASTRSLSEALGAGYLATGRNLGFAGAVNLGLERAAGRDVLLLNPDAVIGPDAVLRLQRFLRDPAHRRAAVGPDLLSATGTERPSWPMPSPGQTWAEVFGLADWIARRTFVTGAVLLLRSEAVSELGGFDERYFLYAEETDWQQRAQEAGWEVAVDHETSAHHVGGASSTDPDRRDYHFLTSNRVFARRWYGTAGAAAMRAASTAAALRRATIGPDRATGRRRLRQSLHLRAPAIEPGRPSVVHVVCTDAFAGVERQVTDIAAEEYRRGWRVTVIGGDPARMRAELPAGVSHLPGATLASAYRSLVRMGQVDVIHAHMTAAEFAAAAAKPRLGARLVATRHFAALRGSTRVAKVIGRRVARRLDVQVAISEYVAASIEGPSTVVHNGVRGSSSSSARTRTVLVLQRFEAEKETDLAVRAWAASGLAARGWELVVHGEGSRLGDLRRLTDELGCGGSVVFPGFSDDPHGALASASVLLATTRIEGFGLTVAEAMAEATPIIAADGGAHREVAGPDAFYFAPGDPLAAARALNEVADLSEDERSELGQRLRARHAALFTVEHQVDQLLALYRDAAPRVALLSLEPWDDVWRRNQHLASRLVRSGRVSSLLFVNPPRGGLALRSDRHQPEPGITVVTPPLVVPRRHGGHRALAAWLRRATDGVDLLWVNDPVAGGATLRPSTPAVYDVTDDWREVDQPEADRRRVVAAEDRLATAARTVVCSRTLARRWRERYAVDATLIGNGVDVAAIRAAQPVGLAGPGPHVIYVGTVHPNRVDISLLRRLAEELPGTLHLVGPDSLDEETRAFLDARGVRRHGRVASADVPGWLVAADVLVCPHLVDDFTLSLDAIKAYEYLCTTKPVVATPSSGFESITAPGLTVVSADGFVGSVSAADGTGPFHRDPPPDWDDRAAEFGAVLAQSLKHHAGAEATRHGHTAAL